MGYCGRWHGPKHRTTNSCIPLDLAALGSVPPDCNVLVPGLAEVAEILSVPTARAYELCRSGMIPVVRIGRQMRVRPSQLDEWLEAGGKPLPGGWRKER